MNATYWEEIKNKAENGDAEAQYDVGICLEEGLSVDGKVIVEIDKTKAFEWFKLSAQKGYMYSKVRVADYLWEEGHTEKAISLYKQYIDEGSSIAAQNLGVSYRDLHMYEEAFIMYEKASEMNGEPSISLALCYYWGIGVKQDKHKAFELFQKISIENASCDFDMNEANYYLAQFYLTGEVVERSLEKCIYYLNLANSDNDHDAAQQLLLITGKN